MRLEVNGRRREVDCPPLKPLALVLREDLRLTGTKVSCGEGICGTCTVGVDGEPVAACLLPVALAAGRSVRTVEGLAEGERLSAVQQALAERGVQCGICTPGMAMSLTLLLEREPRPTEAQVRAALGGNLCRCTGYRGIVEAALTAAGAS